MAGASLSKFIPGYPIPIPISVVLIADKYHLIIALCGGAKYEIRQKKSVRAAISDVLDVTEI